MDQEAIRKQIDRIVHSSALADKKQLCTLLELLSGHIDSQRTLRPDRVARELWPEHNGSKGSPEVAAEMYRLRMALDCYYRDEGRTDPVIIRLPNRRLSTGNGAGPGSWIAAEARPEAEPSLPEPPPDPAPLVAVGPIRLARKLKALAAIAIAALVVGFFAAEALRADNQPNAVRLDGNTLIVMNAEGKVLWSRSFSDGFWPEYYTQGVATQARLTDLDGRGHKSVLLLYHPANATAHSTTLICYSYRGEEKWRWMPGKPLPQLGSDPPTFISRGLAILNVAHRAPRIAVLSGDYPYYPAQIAIIDSHGRTMSEYWHSGHLDFMTAADLDGDGRQEIIATGVDNGYSQATLVVLDPDRMSGASSEPIRPDLQIQGMPVAQERLRLLFPRSDLNLATESYNAAREITFANGTVRLSVWECQTDPFCRVWYEFDRHFALLWLYADDRFRVEHQRYYRTTKDDHAFTAEEEKQFRRIRCLTGCKGDFVPVDIR